MGPEEMDKGEKSHDSIIIASLACVHSQLKSTRRCPYLIQSSCMPLWNVYCEEEEEEITQTGKPTGSFI